tara:strand:- start:196 stop:423 length:228 start_codon:yes stop_codon:yes gene_type:complete
MCKKCVIQWNEAGKQMSLHLENAFNDVIMRDMMTTDEEGMFFLFCWEEGMHGFTGVMADILMGELMFELRNIIRS